MIKKITLSLLSLLFVFSLGAQQSIQGEWGYTWGPDNPKSAFSLSWINAEGLLSGSVVRLNYTNSTNEDNNAYYYYYYENYLLRRDILQLDIAKRWHSSLEKRVSYYVETGLSGMLMDNPLGYSFDDGYNPCCEFCDCLFSPITVPSYNNYGNGEASYGYTRKDRQYEVAFLPGATVGAGLDVNLTKHFYVGAHTRVSSYYEIGTKKLMHYFRGGLNAGFRF